MRKKFGMLLTCILVLGLLAGCNRQTEEETPKPTVTQGAKVTLTPMPGEDVPLTVAPSQTTELPIYTISGDFTELAAVTALVGEEEITEQVVTDAVVEALADNAIYVKVNGVTRENNVIVVDFDAATPPVSQVGSGVEGLILDAFGQSLLDNIPECKGVRFSVDGGDYASGHFEFGKNDIYMRR